MDGMARIHGKFCPWFRNIFWGIAVVPVVVLRGRGFDSVKVPRCCIFALVCPWPGELGPGGWKVAGSKGDGEGDNPWVIIGWFGLVLVCNLLILGSHPGCNG